jgi:peptidoglycan/LPS O-acetylase OafA/YrhL
MPFVRAFPLGAIGVDTFFVLSGFLITTILLENRMRAEVQGNTKKAIIKSFFVRRSLRIFPIYYLFVFACLVFAPMTGTDIRQNALYFLTYTSNFYFYKRQAWDGMVSHLWSLAVEEQFYLLWPWVMLYTPWKHLLFAILTFVGVGVVSGYVIAGRGMSYFALTLPFTCFDAFGLGALLAFVLVFHKKQLTAMHRVLGVVAIVCVLQTLSRLTPWPLLLPLPDRTVYSLMALWLIAGVVRAHEQGTTQPALLTNRVLVFLGKISYGLYLYHNAMYRDVETLYYYLNWRLPAFVMPYFAYVIFAENLVLVVLLSWASWVWLERPILRFKKYFDYQAPQPLPVALPGT